MKFNNTLILYDHQSSSLYGRKSCIVANVTKFVSSQRGTISFIYGLPKHLPYYCHVITAVLKGYKTYDACRFCEQ